MISLARRNSRFSRSSSFMRSRSVLLRPGRRPSSLSAWRTHNRKVSGEQPIFCAIDWIAAHCEEYSSSCSKTTESPVPVPLVSICSLSSCAPSSQKMESPTIPGRFSDRIAVMFEGEIMGIIGRQEASIEQISLWMSGVKEKCA